MEKIIIHLMVPALGLEYDMYIPTTILVSQLTKLIVQAIEEITDKLYISSGNEILCLKEQDIILVQEAVIKSYAIQNGDHIMLI